MPKVRVRNGITLGYADRGAGSPLLMMDGLGARWTWFKNFVPLSQRFRAIALDIRGVGESDKPFGPYSIPEMAGEVADLLTHLGTGPTNIIGMSIGGDLAKELALTYPHLVSRLILVGSSLGGQAQVRPDDSLFSKEMPSSDLSLRENFCKAMSMLLSPRYVEEHPDEIDMLMPVVMQSTAPMHAKMSHDWASRHWPGTANRIHQIRVPAMVMHGEMDQSMPVVNGIRLAQALPGAVLHLFPGSGHLCNVEHADQFNQIVSNFCLGQ